MRSATTTMIAYLNSKEPFFIADLFSIQMPGYGLSLYMTSFDTDVIFGPTTWLAQGPMLTRTGWAVKNTMEVSQLTVKLMSSGADWNPGNIKQMIHEGLLDNSFITLQRAVMPTPGDTSLGLIDLWEGMGGKVTGGARGVEITWSSRNANMLQQMPKNRYKIKCLWPLYSVGCTRLASAFTWNATVDHADGRFIHWTGDPTPGFPDQLAQGYATFYMGAAVGQKRAIDWADGGGVMLSTNLYTEPANGDTFWVTLGCDKTEGAHGCGFFNNQQNFRGFPYIPPPVFAI